MSTTSPIPQPGPVGPPGALPTAPVAPIPPSTIRIKRAREDTPVTALYVNPTLSLPSTSSSKRPKLSTPGTPTSATSTSTGTAGPSYIFRLAHTLPFQPSSSPSPFTSSQIPAVLDDTGKAVDDAGKPGRKRAGTEVGEEGGLPEVSADKRRKIAPVRRYQLTRKRGRAHPYGALGAGAGSRGAVFVQLRDEEGAGGGMVGGEGEGEKKVEGEREGEKVQKERKRPRTHPKEKELFREEREKAVVVEQLADGDALSREMEKLILEYLDPSTNEGIRNLPPTTTPAVKDRVGGGVGGGTWAENKDKDVNMTDDDEDEDGFVYDVYIREEVPAGTVAMETTEDYGVIVFAESEDEAWWYEGAEEEDNLSDVYGSDDEDSNAEDFHTNDYPDEPAGGEDEEDEYGGGHNDDEGSDEDEDDYDDSENENGGVASKWRPWRSRTAPGDEEYDFDDSEEDEEPTLRKLVRGAWSLD
ncbi:hypothetical protein BZA05DRAFT_448784 [Tricharina praecox]|uniref:uncharacterized protein n=1 Tax=Tricharina praecox TaxID=43433 RepID=UPI0022204244|nr:uncharacterized protein BZA05DRAFT_448784 [Tricharina praecox]KAI5843220.1 hypothetical protein BZA05DRAFT_448784 [Tricharina praecox]